MPRRGRAPGKPIQPGRSPHQSHADEDYRKPDCCLADIHRRRVTTVTMNTMITTMNSSKATGPEMIDVPELPPADHICAM